MMAEILSCGCRPMSDHVGRAITKLGIQNVWVAVGFSSLCLSVQELFLLPGISQPFCVPVVSYFAFGVELLSISTMRFQDGQLHAMKAVLYAFHN
jgi:hypothetical protein